MRGILILDEVRTLLELKKATPELGGPQVPAINEFIFAEFDRHGAKFSGQGRPVEESRQRREGLNAVFRDAIRGAAR
ncbi:MAG: hypothetical protein P8Y69_09955 [Gammaproteobacteria bacterium]